MSFPRPLLSALTVLALAFWPLPADLAAETGKPPVVVELFTSQGCSSCPPADRLLSDLATREDVIALSLHVDYWDYIGWTDPFADPAMTARQSAYTRALGERFNYTPEMVVDGRYAVVGSRRGEVTARIEMAAMLDKPVQPEFIAPSTIRLPAGPADTPAAVWMVVFEDRAETDVNNGENAGRRLVNVNVVRQWKRIGTWTGEAADLTLDMSGATADGCAILVQADNGTGPILGAVRIPVPN